MFFGFSDHPITGSPDSAVTPFCRHPILDPASNFDNLMWNQQP